MSRNEKWHKENVIPMPSTLDDRVSWHIAHLLNCDCRKDVPPTVAKAMKKQGKAVCQNGHIYNLPGKCPNCEKRK